MNSTIRRLTFTFVTTTVVGVIAAQSPAQARHLHHRSLHAAGHRAGHAHAFVHRAGRSHGGRHLPRAFASRSHEASFGARTMGVDDRYGDVGPSAGRSFAWSGSNLVAEARRWIGTNPTSRRSLWCARFMNFVLQRTGHRGTGSDMARSFASYGRRISGPQVGAIAVMSRRGGGHVGVVSGIDASGNPIIISGNYRHRVAEAVFPRRRIYAYVMPN